MMSKKILIIFTLMVFLATSVLAPFVKAQENGSWYDPSFEEWSTKVFQSPDNEIFGERYTYAQVKWILYSFAAMLTGVGEKEVSCFIGGTDIGNCIKSIISKTESNDTYAYKDVQKTSSFLDQLSKSPISGVYYFKTIGQKLKLIPEAKAQEEGYGFSALNPMLALWKISRNIVYTIFIIIIIATAFMIMFRVKINPQTVISIQSALPKIIGALILVTFSYAIAGLLIDFLYVVIGILTTILIEGGLFANTTEWTALFDFYTKGPGGTGAFGHLLSYYALFIIGYFISAAQALSTSAFGIMLGAIMGILSIVILLVLFIVLLITIMKLLWLLFRTYVNILLLVITAPFSIAIGSISSEGGGFGSWLRAMLSNLVVYPIVGMMITLAFLFLNGAIFSISYIIPIEDLEKLLHSIFSVDMNLTLLSGKLWSPPLTTGTELTGILWLGASFVIITMTPKVADMIKSIMERKPFPFGTALGEALAPGQYPAAYSIGKIGEGKIPPFYPFRGRLQRGYDRFAATRYGEKITGAIEAGAKGLGGIIEDSQSRKRR